MRCGGILSVGVVLVVVLKPSLLPAPTIGDDQSGIATLASIRRGNYPRWHQPLLRARMPGQHRLASNVQVHGLNDEAVPWPGADMSLSLDVVAKEEGLTEKEVKEHVLKLTEVLGLETLEIEGVNMAAVMRLAVHAPHDVPLRVLKLKTILPNTDVSVLVARCPRLLKQETDLAQVEAEFQLAEASTEQVSRQLLEALMVTAPRIFLMGEPTWSGVWDKVTSEESNGGGKLVGDCCNEARRKLGCNNDTETVMSMINDPIVIFRLAPLQGWRPPSAYSLFTEEHMQSIAEDLSPAEKAKMMGQAWASLEPDVKQAYVDKAGILMSQHEKDYADYLKSCM
eukprot:gnl/TRDRNA2_/TRDRNA2_136988_c0_seq1.p1 gnl/TRDRNA2_/TRDRNA2_136988_c0~~gnl/TRDRNA2_/TRDRNA2_136988_c0_seq1.p1  ORF type:complete len:339 (-),score=53.77 gnl/TRDRNA2_/TRDRNA2_136988_c0_seq1:82-1098(-)